MKKDKRTPIYYNTKEEWLHQRGVWAYEYDEVNARLEGYLSVPSDQRGAGLMSAISNASQELKRIREERELCIIDNPQYYI